MKDLIVTTFLFAGLTISSIPKDLPTVLIIGDSISIGYLPHVQDLLNGEAEVDRIPPRTNGKPENCQGTTNGVANIDRWLGNQKWDVIHFNFGLHDLKHIDSATGRNSTNPNDPPQANIDQYASNLRAIVLKLEATGAKLIFATTTPYPEGTRPYREFGEETKYNTRALAIMQDHDIAINDLHAFVLPRMEELQKPINVHFTAYGSEKIAERVAESIRNQLRVK